MADSAEFKFDSTQWKKILNKINDKWKKIENRREYGGIISATVYADIIQHFDDERGPEGKWAGWSKVYQEHLSRIGRGGNKILQFSGRLRQSFTPEKWRATGDGIIFYNNALTKKGFPYAYAHDTGGPKLPKRKFMWLSKNAAQGIVDKTEKWLSEGL